MAESQRHLKIRYDPEGDYLEVIFDQKAGYFRETENDQVMAAKRANCSRRSSLTTLLRMRLSITKPRGLPFGVRFVPSLRERRHAHDLRRTRCGRATVDDRLQ